MSSDEIRRIADEVRRAQDEKPSKANRIYVAEEPQYTIFQAYCRKKGVPMNSVLDRLVRAFLEAAVDDPDFPTDTRGWRPRPKGRDGDGAA